VNPTLRTRVLITATAVGSFLLPAARLAAEQHLLVIGGGYAPTGNQISLEKNVQFFRRLIRETSPGAAPPLDLYFSDGRSSGRDLVYEDPQFQLPKANRYMAMLLDKEKYLGLRFRSHQLDNARGASDPEEIARWFDEVGSRLDESDRLLVYITAHGGKSKNKKRPYNSHIWLWNRQKLSVAQLAGHLQKLPPEVPVVLVMVQCYSGGFAHLIFGEGDKSKGLADRSICGFFATVHDRPAAGCTPDINEEDYHEYSSYFWAGLGGRTRTGIPIQPPDYNEDGQVSLDEAHAYTIIASPTIDIPVKTSDALLRRYSRGRDDEHPELLGFDDDYNEIWEAASTSERKILAELSAQLDLIGNKRSEDARNLAKEIENQRERLAGQRREKKDRYQELRDQIRRSLQSRWPELANVLNPEVTGLLTTSAFEFVEAVESHEKFSELVQLAGEIDTIDTARLDEERRWVKCQRFLRTVENIVLAANLPSVAEPQILRRYEQLLAFERAPLYSSIED